ncbi:hypothetical protein T484DRAFT_1760939 [Baffinella frigidus]|nr:hypothetical protein T484DRAFT_1760939 [Cryptophyta sp. CCMP2293]
MDWAERNGHIQILVTLDGFTAMDWAERNGVENPDLVNVGWVELGAGIGAVALDGFTAMDWAERNGHVQTMLQLSALKDKQKPGASGRPGPGTVTEFDASGAVVRVRHVGLVPIAFPEDDPFVRMDRFEWEDRPLVPSRPTRLC